MVKQQQFYHKLEQLNKLFDFRKVLSSKTDNLSIAKYYKVNRLFYTFLSNTDNFIHMPITINEKIRKEDFFVQANLISDYIKKDTKNILELAAGRGANSIYLANKFPKVNFIGIDLPNGQLDFAVKNGRGFANFKPQTGDFHDLSEYSDDFFDIVFIIEALCHSSKKEQVTKQVIRVLKKNGIFIVVDGFSNKQELNEEEKLAKGLVEKSMNLAGFDNYNEFIRMLQRNNLKLIFEKDYSSEIMPSLKRFEKDAKILVSLPLLIGKLIIKVLPFDFTKNAIAGYLLLDMIKLKLAKYAVIVSQKQSLLESR